MILYVETNFLLELSYLQEEHAACEALIDEAREKRLELAVPALAWVEARENLRQQQKKRKAFHDQLIQQLRELARLKPHSEIIRDTQSLERTLLGSSTDEIARFEELRKRLLANSRVISLSSQVLTESQELAWRFDLTPHDAVILGSVVHDLRTTKKSPSCFVTRNSKDFSAEALKTELAGLNCKVLFSFPDALNWTGHQSGSVDSSPSSGS